MPVVRYLFRNLCEEFGATRSSGVFQHQPPGILAGSRFINTTVYLIQSVPRSKHSPSLL